MRQFIGILIAVIFITAINAPLFAQRRVVRTPHRTIVHTPHRTVVYKRRPVVRIVRRLPPAAVVIHYRARPYYYHHGVFYIAKNGTYIRTVPPVGIRVVALPVGFVRLTLGAAVFLYAEGVFYEADKPSGEYVVVKPPGGAVVCKIPSEAAKVEVDGQSMMEYNSILYESVIVEHKPAYRVVGTLDE